MLVIPSWSKGRTPTRTFLASLNGNEEGLDGSDKKAKLNLLRIPSQRLSFDVNLVGSNLATENRRPVGENGHRTVAAPADYPFDNAQAAEGDVDPSQYQRVASDYRLS